MYNDRAFIRLASETAKKVFWNFCQVGYAAHIGGAVVGLLLGIVVLRNLRVRKWERVFWWICLLLFLGLFLAGIVWNAVIIGLNRKWKTTTTNKRVIFMQIFYYLLSTGFFCQNLNPGIAGKFGRAFCRARADGCSQLWKTQTSAENERIWPRRLQKIRKIPN